MPTWISPNLVATSFREALFEQYVITDLSILNPTERETPVTISFFTEIGTLLESYSGTWLVGPRSCLVHKAEEPDGVDTFGTGWVEITAPVSIVPAGRVRATWRRVSEAPPRSQTLVGTTRVVVFYEKQEPMVPSILSSLMRVEERWLSADWRAFESRSPELRVVGDTTITLVHLEALFDKLATVERQSIPRDGESEALIRDKIARQPGAPYYMARTSVPTGLSHEARPALRKLKASTA